MWITTKNQKNLTTTGRQTNMIKVDFRLVVSTREDETVLTWTNHMECVPRVSEMVCIPGHVNTDVAMLRVEHVIWGGDGSRVVVIGYPANMIVQVGLQFIEDSFDRGN